MTSSDIENELKKAFLDEYEGQWSVLFLELAYYKPDTEVEFFHASLPSGWTVVFDRKFESGNDVVAVFELREEGEPLPCPFKMQGEKLADHYEWYPSTIEVM